MAEQVAGLRRMAEALRGDIQSTLRAHSRRSGVRIVAVTSGKGGVGKTNFAVNLALAMVEQGQPALLVDADLGLANADLILGAEPPYHLGNVLRGQVSLGEAVFTGPGGLRLLAGGTALEELANLPPERIMQFLSQLPDAARSGDLVLIDTGAGLAALVRAFLGAAPEVIVVTTPEPTAIADAYATIKVMARENQGVTVFLVVNQAEHQKEAREASRTLVRVASRYLGVSLRELGSIPRDPCVPRSVREKRPFFLAAPSAPASQAVRAVAARLQGEDVRHQAGWGSFIAIFLKGLLRFSADGSAKGEPTGGSRDRTAGGQALRDMGGGGAIPAGNHRGADGGGASPYPLPRPAGGDPLP